MLVNETTTDTRRKFTSPEARAHEQEYEHLILVMYIHGIKNSKHRDTMSILLPSKMATNTMVSGHYAVNHVLFSSGAPPCGYSTLVSYGF